MRKTLIWVISTSIILSVGFKTWTLTSSFLNAPRLGETEIKEVLDENIDGDFEIHSIDRRPEGGEYVVIYDIKNDECEYNRAWINTNKELTEDIPYKCH